MNMMTNIKMTAEEKLFAAAMNDLIKVSTPNHRVQEDSIWTILGLGGCSPAGLEKIAPMRPLIAQASERGLIPSRQRRLEGGQYTRCC